MRHILQLRHWTGKWKDHEIFLDRLLALVALTHAKAQRSQMDLQWRVRAKL